MGISLSHRRYEEIKRIIVDLFVKYDVTCVPVNGFELATKMGIKIIPYSAISFTRRYLLFKKAKMDSVQRKHLENGISTIMMKWITVA